MKKKNIALLIGAGATDYSTIEAMKNCKVPILFIHGMSYIVDKDAFECAVKKMWAEYD